MRQATAVRRLRTIAERCQQACELWEEGVGLVAVCAFGGVLDRAGGQGAALEVVQIALIVGGDPQRVPWCARPPEFAGLPYVLGLEKAPVDWYFRSAELPVGNHLIVRPLRIWDRRTGVDETALQALAAGRAQVLRDPAPGPIRLRQQLADELAAGLAHLQRVRDGYWQRGWRADHHAAGCYPEHHLWDAVHGYLDLVQAVQEVPVDRGRDHREDAEDSQLGADQDVAG
jgi:hypothetical protein